MTKTGIYKVATYCIAAVWIANGLFCKVLNLVPRHEQIVARILGYNHSGTITLLTGLSEIGMAIWVLTNYKSRLSAIFQMIVVATMNILEFVLAPDLLLWGRFNAVFALLFIGFVYFNEFVLNNKLNRQPIK